MKIVMPNPKKSISAKTCPAIPNFANGRKILLYGDGTGYGTVYHYECSPGYTRVGAPTLLCQTNGQWSFEQPYCKSMFLKNFYNP